MLLLRLSLGLLLAWSVHAANVHSALECLHPASQDIEACSQPVEDVVAIVPGSSYAAKIECKDCPYAQITKGHPRNGHTIEKNDLALFLNLTLSHDNRTVLLNKEPFYPLPTIPHPPAFYVTQFPSTFSNSNLSSGIDCANPFCQRTVDDCEDWCWNLPLSAVRLDYLYTTKPTEYNGDDKDPDARYWEITLDLIGGKGPYVRDPYWKFDDADQKMLWMLVAGKEPKTNSHKSGKDTKPASDLFAPFGEEEKTYEYRIVDMRLEARTYQFPAPRPLSIWRTIGRFFGNDIWDDDRFLYLGNEWGPYGKLGTLRNSFGEFVHWESWYLFWIILGSIIGGAIILSGLYHLYFWILQQRELAKWDGMDDVWDRLRRESIAEEEDALLDGAYRDEPDEGSSSRPPRYTDDPRTMKPLPSKPLPEKPLPEVPLIDA